MHSITARLLTSTAIVLAIFAVLTALSVRYSVHRQAELATYDKLRGLIYGMLGASEIESGTRLTVNTAALPDPRLNQPTTGLYVEFVGNDGSRIWQSTSSTVIVPELPVTPIGEWTFGLSDKVRGESVHFMQLTTAWELDSGEELPFMVQAVSNANELKGQLKRFDQTLWGSLLVSVIGLLIVQLWILHKSLSPLHHIGEELREIELGDRPTLNENVPSELKPLAKGINTLLGSERNRHKHYRNLLNDLAHSLKTPLSVLSNLTSTDSSKNSSVDVVHTQTAQMKSSIDRYLQRATLERSQFLSTPISPLPVLERICSSLEKLYGSRSITFNIKVTEEFVARVADADLYEILGNVLENSVKFGATLVTISSEKNWVIVEDNGPGFPEESIDRLLHRGARADMKVEGQGLGLAAARELIQAYGGSISLGNTGTKGARVAIRFP
jgi:two-component system sensor histidine kinase PhoQ